MSLKVIATSFVAALYFQSIAVPSIATLDMPHAAIRTEHPEIAQPQDAIRLWEQAIAAKGGRDRLHAVRNIVISLRGEYRTGSFKKNKGRTEALYVFPNKSWEWIDLRPDVFGLVVEMYNYDTNMKYVISDGEPKHLPEPISDNEKSGSRMYGLLSYLLETRWPRPTPIKAATGRIGMHAVDVVETKVNGQRVDFALDNKTHLPIRVSYYDVIKGKIYITTVGLSDYLEINGIKVPTAKKNDDGTKDKLSYQLNVEYNDDIFIKPPPLAAGPEAWRSKRKS